MQVFFQFITHHWLLSSLLLVLLILLLIEEARTKGLLNQLTPQNLVQLMNHESAVVVDIRSRENFQEGHIVSAINLPASELEKNTAPLSQFKNKPIVIVCATGQKAGTLANLLKKQGFQNVQVLAGGINGWKNAQMPIVKK
ncbi:MAG: rhodanese-like domain-containing protein [Proteobacteria bacterium]|nr:rhodanese-like domain-containing protein [Pseudomonadota bacterium]